MRTFRLHFERGISRKKYDDLIARLSYGAWQYRPVKGPTGYIAAVDVLTGDLETAQFVATKITARGKRRVVRAKVVRVDEPDILPPDLPAAAQRAAPLLDRLILKAGGSLSPSELICAEEVASELRRATAVAASAEKSKHGGTPA